MDAGAKAKKGKSGCLKYLIAFLIVSILGTALTAGLTRETTETVLPAHTELFYINDYSHVFSGETEAFIAEQGRALYDAYGAQIVVAAVPDTGSDSIEDFSLDLLRDWGIGDAEKDNGVLLLFTTEEAHVRMEIGYGLEGCLNDAKCGRILDDYAVEPMHAGEWNRAALQTWIETARTVYEEYGAEPPAALSALPGINEDPGTATSADATMPEPITVVDDQPFLMRMVVSFCVFWLIFGPVIVIVFISVLLAKRGGGGSGGSRSSYSGSSYSGGGFGGGGSSGGGGSGGGGGATR